MKIRSTLLAICVLLVASLALVSCGDDKKNDAPAKQSSAPVLDPAPAPVADEQTEALVEWKELANRNYVLAKINNEDFVKTSKVPSIKFKEDNGIAGNVCNNFTGPATLENNVLKAANLAATKMLCDGALNTLEGDFFKALHADGLKVSIADKNLTLSNASLTLEFIEE